MRLKLCRYVWDEEHQRTRKVVLMDMDAWDLVQSWLKFAYGVRIDRDEEDLHLAADGEVVQREEVRKEGTEG